MSTNDKRIALGIDFGGTSTKLGVVDEHGAVLARTAFSTSEAAAPEAWLEAVAVEQAKLLEEAKAGGILSAIGVGVPGFVDFERGYIHDLTNVPGWTGIELADILRKRFQVPAFVDNDVNAMAVGECTFGAGRMYQHAVCVTLGTGVGGALLIHNKLYRGARSMAGEIGHMSIDMDGVPTSRGRGGLEEYVGNEQIVQLALDALDTGQASTLLERAGGDEAKITVRLLAEVAAEGDELACEIFGYVADCLATVFASVTYLIQPQVFIVGGGVAQSGDVLFGPLRRHLGERLSPFFAEHVEIKTAELGTDAGLVGAGTLALISA